MSTLSARVIDQTERLQRELPDGGPFSAEERRLAEGALKDSFYASLTMSQWIALESEPDDKILGALATASVGVATELVRVIGRYYRVTAAFSAVTENTSLPICERRLAAAWDVMREARYHEGWQGTQREMDDMRDDPDDRAAAADIAQAITEEDRWSALVSDAILRGMIPTPSCVEVRDLMRHLFPKTVGALEKWR